MKPFPFLSIILLLLLSQGGYAQKPSAVFVKRIEELKATLSRAEVMMPWEAWGDLEEEELEGEDNSIGSQESINVQIYWQLTQLLAMPEVARYNLDSLLSHPYLMVTGSPDKRLWVISWYENTGGTFKSHMSVLHYRTKKNQPKVVCGYCPEEEEAEFSEEEFIDDSFCSNGAAFDAIHLLKNSYNRNLYFVMGFVSGCSTCCAYVASIVELTDDSISFTYPGFLMQPYMAEGEEPSGEDLEGEGQQWEMEEPLMIESCFFMDSRCGNILKFQYDPVLQEITYTYITDDNTPIGDYENQKKVKGKLIFDGEKFVESFVVEELDEEEH
jgi:hypothetical protein